MKLPFFSARVFTVALLCLGCGGDDSQRSTSTPAPSVSSRLDNPTASSNRALAAFRSVDLQAGCRVTLRKGATHNAALEGPSELLQGLKLIAQPNGQLLIRMLEEYDNRNFDKVSITLYTPGPVSGLAISGSGHLTVQDSFDGIETMSVSGSGTIQTATSLRTDRLTASLAGSGNIAAYTLQADKLDCSIAGSGNISINVSNKIDANIAGSGSLFYKGNPIVEQNITGSGQITKQ